MTYDTPQALRTALEARIRNQSAASGLSPDRLRRRVVFQRIVTRLQRAEPGRWVLKGGMAMEVWASAKPTSTALTCAPASSRYSLATTTTTTASSSP